MSQFYYELVTDSYPVFILSIFYCWNTDSAEDTKTVIRHVMLNAVYKWHTISFLMSSQPFYILQSQFVWLKEQKIFRQSIRIIWMRFSFKEKNFITSKSFLVPIDDVLNVSSDSVDETIEAVLIAHLGNCIGFHNYNDFLVNNLIVVLTNLVYL